MKWVLKSLGDKWSKKDIWVGRLKGWKVTVYKSSTTVHGVGAFDFRAEHPVSICIAHGYGTREETQVAAEQWVLTEGVERVKEAEKQ
jgi:hypothetical protein